jgi:hypothetical protein
VRRRAPWQERPDSQRLPAAPESAGSWGMATVRLIKHEAAANCGSYEVRFPDGRPSKFFYWDDVAGRRTRPERMTREQALELAKAFARAERAG